MAYKSCFITDATVILDMDISAGYRIKQLLQ